MEKDLRFYQIPEFLFRLPDTTFQERMIISIIYHYQKSNSKKGDKDKIYPTQSLIKQKLGYKENNNNLPRTFKGLEIDGWIKEKYENGYKYYVLCYEKYSGFITENDYYYFKKEERKTPCTSQTAPEKTENIERNKSVDWKHIEELYGAFPLAGDNYRVLLDNVKVSDYLKNIGMTDGQFKYVFNKKKNDYTEWQEKQRMKILVS